MVITFEEFAARPFDFISTHVQFVVDNAYHDEFMNSIDDVQDCIDYYRDTGCEEVYVISE